MPSYYSVFIFILPASEIQTVTGGGARVASQEKMCSGQMCREVTAGLYISQEELSDLNFFTNLIEDAIGLE